MAHETCSLTRFLLLSSGRHANGVMVETSCSSKHRRARLSSTTIALLLLNTLPVPGAAVPSNPRLHLDTHHPSTFIHPIPSPGQSPQQTIHIPSNPPHTLGHQGPDFKPPQFCLRMPYCLAATASLRNKSQLRTLKGQRILYVESGIILESQGFSMHISSQ